MRATHGAGLHVSTHVCILNSRGRDGQSFRSEESQQRFQEDSGESRCSVIQNETGCQDEDTAPQTSPAFYRELGFEPGRSLPFASPTQVLVWEDDTIEAIQRAFTGIAARVDGKAQDA